VKASYSAHSRSVISLTAARLTKRRPASSVNASSMSRVDSPRANSSMARSSRVSVRPARFARIAEANGSAVARTCGAENITIPSAVFMRPVR
jgi:hypothetical protein